MATLKLPKAYSQYGASMGRGTQHAPFRGEVTTRLSLTVVRLNSGGYDDGGAYWGIGERLYRVTGTVEGESLVHGGEHIEFYLRAADRDHAKAQIRALGYTSARFYR